MGVDGSSKSPLFDGRGQFVNDNEQVRGNEVTFEEPHEILANEDDIVKGCSEDRRYFTRERDRLENGGRTTICFNMVRNALM